MKRIATLKEELLAIDGQLYAIEREYGICMLLRAIEGYMLNNAIDLKDVSPSLADICDEIHNIIQGKL